MSDDSYESALVMELQALAGVPPGTGNFGIRFGAGTITVDYRQFSSSPSELKLSARYDDVARVSQRPLVAMRPLDIQLRHEDLEDRKAKADGHNVEWQAGDRAFDDAVYVSTPGHSAEVLGALLTPDVRAAVMSLFALGFRMVNIDAEDGLVRADVTEFIVARPQAGRGRDAINAFARLLTSMPVVVASGARPPPIPFAGTTSLFFWTAVIFLVVFVLMSFGPALMSPAPSPNSFGFYVWVGGPWVALALGVPFFLIANKLHRDLVASRMRGSSRTFITAQRAGMTAGFCALLVVATVLHAISLALFVLQH